MDGQKLDRMRVLVTCGLCSNLTKDPRILDCDHNFCLNCLKNRLEITSDSDQANCPLCKNIFCVPNGGVEYLKKNDFLVKFYETYMASMLCDICSSKMAESRCEQCSQYYCSICSSYHRKVLATKDHVLTPLEGITLESNDYVICQDHGTNIDLFCKGCSQFVCVKCFSANHNGHEMMLITDKFEEVKAYLTGIVTSKNEILSKLHQEQETANPRRSESGRQADIARNLVRQRGEVIKNAIVSQVAELCTSVDSYLDAYQAKVDSIIETLENLETKVGSDIKSYEARIRDMNFKTLVGYATPEVQQPEPEIPMFREVFELNFESSKDGEIFTTPNVVGNVHEKQV